MEPTIKSGEILEVEKGLASLTFARWEVVVFEPPIGTGLWVSRIVGLPGELVEIRPDGLYIDGRAVSLPPHLSIGAYQLPKSVVVPQGAKKIAFPYKIPPRHYFLLGDNVSNSLDSRYWGGLEESKILGKVLGK
jgi:signal peptidase I